MRRVLLGALVGSFAFHAQALSEEGLYDFTVGRADASAEDLKREESDIILAMQELERSRVKRPGDEPSELDLLIRERDAKTYEAAFGNYIKSTVRPQSSSVITWRNRLNESAASFETKIKETDAAKLDLKKGESKILEEKSFPVEKGSPFQVVQQLRVVKKDEGKHEVLLSYNLKFDPTLDRKEWPASLRASYFSKMSEKDMEKYVNDTLNPALNREDYAYSVGNLETLKSDDAKRADALKKLPSDAANQVAVKVFGDTSVGAVNVAVKERNDKIGSVDKPLSELWLLNKDIERKQDVKGSKDKMADLQAKLKIAEALRKNPKLAEGKDTCELIVSILGKDGFGKLSRESKMECESLFKREQVAKEENKKEEELEQKDKEQQQTYADSLNKQMSEYAQGCLARANAMAANAPANQPQMSMVRSLYGALVARGAGCTYLGSVLGDVTQQDAQDDAFKQMLFQANPALLQQNPMLAMDQVSPGMYNAKAKEAVSRMAPPAAQGKTGVDSMLAQRECLAKLDGVVGFTLASINPFDPDASKIQKFQEAARSLIGAIDEELAVRKMSGSAGLQPLSAGNNSGINVNRGVSAGGRTPVRIRDTATTTTERGMSGNGTMNRMNSGSRTGGSRSTPPPNF
jgi:hypothetical protein